MIAKPMQALAIVTLLVALSVACGDDSPRNTSAGVDDGLTKINRAKDGYFNQLCQCYADELYNGDIATCIEAETPSNLTWTGCRREVADCHADVFTRFADCASDALSDGEDCFASCPETERHADYCASKLEDDGNECARIRTTDFDEGMEACENGESFACPE